MIPPYDIGPPNCYFLGLPMSQNRYAVPAWSYAFEQLHPARIIEIGTGEGGFTGALAFAADHYECADFLTVDIKESYPFWKCLAEHRLTGDVFSEDIQNRLKIAISNHGVSYLFCDGGNKFREFQTFAPFLKPGDVIGVHDLKSDAWPFSEITEEQVHPLCEELNLQPWLPDVFANTGWLVRRKA